MEEVSRKLEVMLSKLQKMNINMLNLWFPHLDKEEILRSLRESSKFKFEGDYVRIKTYEEIYEEELKRKLEDIENGDLNEEKTSAKEEVKPEKIAVKVEEPVANKNENIKKESKVKKINFADNIVIEEQPLDINKISGAELEYEDILRIVKEYNKNVEFRLEKFDGNSFDAKTKAILEFYGTKYNLEKEKVDDESLGISMYSLTNKRKNLEAGYVVISSVLDEKIVEYMSENYSDEVLYFCPINGTTKEFEFDLNEFFVKDTTKIFKKFLKKCVVSDESEVKIKKVEIVAGL